MKIDKDKKQHFAVGAIAAVAVGLLVGISHALGTPAAMVFGGAMLGLGWEAVQVIRHDGVPDWRDVAFTAGGSTAIALLVWLVS